MSKSGVACYRNGGCGPYEMYSCSECPASKSDYVQFKRKPVTNYDLLIRKTPEELAAKIEELCQYAFMQISVYAKPFGKAEWLEWLKQEANE